MITLGQMEGRPLGSGRARLFELKFGKIIKILCYLFDTIERFIIGWVSEKGINPS